MCLGIPVKILTIKGKKAKVRQNDHAHWLDISLIDEPVEVGDFVIAYQQAAVNKIPAQQAEEILKLIKKAS